MEEGIEECHVVRERSSKDESGSTWEEKCVYSDHQQRRVLTAAYTDLRGAGMVPHCMCLSVIYAYVCPVRHPLRLSFWLSLLKLTLSVSCHQLSISAVTDSLHQYWPIRCICGDCHVCVMGSINPTKKECMGKILRMLCVQAIKETIQQMGL